jgi:hypothetical protein
MRRIISAVLDYAQGVGAVPLSQADNVSVVRSQSSANAKREIHE